MFEHLIPRRPLSHQAKSSKLKAWKNYVNNQAHSVWSSTPLKKDGIRLTLVYLCNNSPADIDNIIKPIQDALIGVVLDDDSLISDVDSHRRFLTDLIDITNLPSLLKNGVLSGEECVYIRVSQANALESYL